MKRYKLLKDLPYAKAGEEMEMWSDGTIAFTNRPDLPRFNKKDVRMFPLWFEEIKDSEEHFYIDSKGKIEYTHSDWDKGMLQLRKSIGNHFETKEEAEEHLAYLKAKVVVKEDTNGFIPDWNDESQLKFSVSYDYKNRKMVYNQSDMIEHIPIYFSNQTALQDSLLKHKEEWMKLFIGEQ